MCLSCQLLGADKAMLTVDSLRFKDVTPSATQALGSVIPTLFGSPYAPPDLAGRAPPDLAGQTPALPSTPCRVALCLPDKLFEGFPICLGRGILGLHCCFWRALSLSIPAPAFVILGPEGPATKSHTETVQWLLVIVSSERI